MEQFPLVQIGNAPFSYEAVDVLKRRDDVLGSLAGSGELKSLLVDKRLAGGAREQIVQGEQTTHVYNIRNKTLQTTTSLIIQQNALWD
jgi:ABC-type transporter Mla maintaining outer membrane lipid asymmetry ATPase subunit MlaF